LHGPQGEDLSGFMGAEKEKTLMEWRVHLARRQPRKTIGAIAAVLAGSGLVFISSRNPLLAALCVLLLLAAAAEFLFPVCYRLTESGAYMRNFLSFRHLPWTQVRRCYRGQQGIKLSPLSRSGWREAFRGLYLWVEGEQQERAVEIIRALRPSATEARSPRNVRRASGQRESPR